MMRRGGKAMIKHVYVYLVLFATQIMTIGGSVSAFIAELKERQITIFIYFQHQLVKSRA